MAGGTWTSQNKVRPGAYINFKAVPASSSSLGIRGIMTMPVELTWGPQKEIIELYSTDLTDGKSLTKIGLGSSDAESLIFRQALSNCFKAYIYRMDVGGQTATATVSNVTATAKYPGTSGNNISFSIVENASANTYWDVITYFRGTEKFRQTILKSGAIEQLEDNDFIVWTGTDALPSNPVVATALTGGTNGTIPAEPYTDYLAQIKNYVWNTMAIPQDDSVATESIKANIVTFIKGLRENEGKKVQAVLHNYSGIKCNYEGIISVRQGYKTQNETISPNMFTAYIAGITAGSEVNVSNTYKVIEGAVSIVYEAGITPYDNAEILQRIAEGDMIVSTRQDGSIVIEQDINTLHKPYPSADVNYAFSKNRVIRTLDGINNAITNLFEGTYIGKISNNADGRNVFKADIISYMTRLQNINAIQNFTSDTDVAVIEGEAIDSVVVNLAAQPVDSMEKLYMTVNVY